MDTNSSVFKVLNLYSFVKTAEKKTTDSYITQRLWEHNLMVKQRNAVSYCKKVVSINTSDLSRITNEEKESIEKCLIDNFLNRDPNYFGERDTIFLDLNNYY